MRSGEVAQAAGVNQQTLRYYERRGLLAEPLRTPGGHRLYPAETVTVVRVIKAAQRLGFSLEEVAQLISTGLCGRSKRGSGLREHAAAKLAEIEAKIADLSVIADTLRAALDAGCADLVECARHPDCPLPLDALDVADPRASVAAGGHAGEASSGLPSAPALAASLRHTAPGP
jgi:MerR family transcriptional regulator, mercuric resistance operon regulatory protein